MEKQLQTTQRRTMMTIIQTKRQTVKRSRSCACRERDVTADSEPHEQGGTTRLSTTTKTPTSKKKAATTPTATPPSTKRQMMSQKKNWNQGSTAPDLLEAGKDDCQAPRRLLDQACLKLEPSNFNQAERVPETRKTGREMGRRPQRPLTTRWSQQRQQRPHERHDLAHHDGGQLEMGCHGKRLLKQQTQTTSSTHDPHHHRFDNPTNNS